MEGTLLVPPDRGSIIGRAAWKPRYLVVGPPKDTSQPNTAFSQVLSAARIKDSSNRSSKLQTRIQPDLIYLSIYKTKDDWEPVQQHSMASITNCVVQNVAYRKQGPILPTLAVQISPDPATDKLRKRRSSRTAGLTTTKESGPTTLWFRLGDDRTYTLEDWASYIQSLMPPDVLGKHPISPISPISPSFINPFSPSSSRDTGEFFGTSSGSSSKTWTKRPGKSGHAHASSRDAATTYTSGTPSIRSNRSDVSSSHASSMVPISTGYTGQHYTTVHPSDLPSPATTIGGEYQDQFIEGWTSAQGRSSTLGSPVRTRESISSAPAQFLPSLHSSSPPGQRETILDRAFQLRCIPGSDREVPGEEKLSSIARFEALMREVEERQKAFEAEKRISREPLKSTSEKDESDENDGVDEVNEEDSGGDAFEQDLGADEIGPSAQRALQFIANRHSSGRSHRSHQSVRSVPTYQESSSSIHRPHTAHSRSRPAAQRTNSQPYIPTASLDLTLIPSRVPEEPVTRINHEKRQSVSDGKRLSFNEFTKRLSGTSSLLLVQTNASNGSSRGSSEIDGPLQMTPPRNGALSPRGGAMSPTEREERCRWRGSVGVFGNEGGFL
ncbi:uncharacterized protein F4812DRAFT_460660 [Daldinia caldariorum]|uniref:uncharacterized protein n=1 Tax=Daldinia caldariorum TaxID=326644 RepID=UPI002008302C|nr:uncharacterized protein F4812DRAFT_460660 [Daldinia caldariorum]KAI1466387.1 hypothetical protein F4812DRAFT_460660 [Daldinia caldariorum]